MILDDQHGMISEILRKDIYEKYPYSSVSFSCSGLFNVYIFVEGFYKGAHFAISKKVSHSMIELLNEGGHSETSSQMLERLETLENYAHKLAWDINFEIDDAIVSIAPDDFEYT